MSFIILVYRVKIKERFPLPAPFAVYQPFAVYHMKHSQKAKYIILTCMLAVGVCSAAALLKALRPSAGLPYENVTMEQAMEYMAYEQGYVLLDIGTDEEYISRHIPGAVHIPYDDLVAGAARELPDKSRVIYVYGREEKQEDKACRKLSELGYTGITCIGMLDDWPGEFEGTDT